MSTHEKADKAVRFVVYELSMFRGAVARLGSLPQNADLFTKNALLEVMLLHARALREFFATGKQSKGMPRQDIFARHYLNDESLWTKEGVTFDYLEAERERINRALAHLSYSRLDYEDDKGWNDLAIIGEIENAWRQLYKVLSPEMRQRFDEEMSNQMTHREPGGTP